MPNQDNTKTILLVMGGVLLTSSIRQAFGLSNNPNLKDKFDRHKDDIKNNPPNPSKLSLPRQAYKNIAEIQYEAMNRAGTNEKKLFRSLKGLNRDDLLTVNMDFGLRARTILGGTVAISGRRNLMQWYRSELSGSDLQKMLKIWQKTGLTHLY